MSSQAVATPLPGGLPPSPPPAPDLPNYSPPTWSEHTNAPQQLFEHSKTEANPEYLSASRPSYSNSPEQHRQALNNLLAALAPINASKPSPPNQPSGPPLSNGDVRKSVSPLSPDVNHHSPVTNNAQVTYSLHSSLLENFPPLPSYPEDLTTLGPQPQGLELLNTAMSGTTPSLPPPMPSIPPQPPINDRREIEAFAKIEFEDGNYYITTWACELGRDALAFRAALQRAEEAKNNPNGRSQSSSGRVSRPSDRVRRAGDSQVQGSVVSEAGGFGGVDDGPLVRSDEKPAESGHPSHSSQVSNSDIVKPQEVLYHPPLAPFDYHRNAELQAHLDPDDEQPAPVTAEHLPNADTCPLIPIHAMANSTKSEVATHKGISRRHVRIEWDSDFEYFKMKVLGRNGAFLDGAFVTRGATKPLSSGSKIQISDIQMTFRLPRPKTEPISDDSDRDEREGSPIEGDSTSPTSDEGDEILATGGKTKRISFTNKTTGLTEPIIGPDGQPLPPRKRGPGRPPKDGIMSTRERKERERAAKLAAAKAANGGKTPPPSATSKMPKFTETPKTEPKSEKRKYTKRKRDGDDGDILPSIEGEEENVGSDTEKIPAKKPRASKSPSPEYPALVNLTEEQLARPSEPYARLIYDILADIHPKALPLKQIYRALKMKFPFFVYRVESEGWQSSVRHNLNQEWNKLFEKGEKEGKGFAWKAIPGALQPQAERKRAAQAAAAAKPKPTPRPPPQNQGPVPPLNWQNSTPYPPPPFWQGPGPYPPPPHGMPWPPPPGSMPQPPPGQGPPQMPPNSNMPPHHIPKPGTHQSATPVPPQHLQRPPSTLPSQPQQQPPRPPSQPPPKPTSTFHPPPSSSTSAAPNMPCTLDGLMAIRRFETAMYDQINRGPNPNTEMWQQIFASVKNRLLHGAQTSNMPGGETKEEVTIMGHVRTFIEKFRNPNFVGFRAAGSVGTGSRSVSRTTSPVPGGGVGGVGGAVVTSAPASTSNEVVNGAINELQGQGVTGEIAASTTNGKVKTETSSASQTSVNATTNGAEVKEH